MTDETFFHNDPDRETGPPDDKANNGHYIRNVKLWTMTHVIGMAELGSLAAVRELKRRHKEGNHEATRVYRRLFPKDNDNAHANLPYLSFA